MDPLVYQVNKGPKETKGLLENREDLDPKEPLGL